MARDTKDRKKMTRKEQAAQTQKKIAETIASLLTEYKFQDLTVNMICERAGVSVGTFYHYYPSKDFILLFKYLSDEYFEDLTENHAFTGDCCQNVAFWMYQYFYYVEKYFGLDMQIELFRSQLVHHADQNAEFFVESRPFIKKLRRLLEEGVEKGQLTDQIPVRRMVDELLRCSNGHLFDWCVKNGSYSVTEDAMIAVSRLLEAYRA